MHKSSILIVIVLTAWVLPGCPPAGGCLECGGFAVVGAFDAPEILECSGLAASRVNPGVLWTHNDSGDTARLFAVTGDGFLLGIYVLEGTAAVDWEDMALGPCSEGSPLDCLYVGDIGDNGHSRSRIQIYRVEEPTVPLEGPVVEETLTDVERLDCVYSDGPRDAETLLVDPETAIPYIVTKEAQGSTGVYRFPAPPIEAEEAALEKLTVIDNRSFLTGGDAAADGSRVILRNYLTAFDYPRPPEGAFEDIFFEIGCIVPLALEIQGEALAIDPSGLSVITVSEGEFAPIHRADCSLPQ